MSEEALRLVNEARTRERVRAVLWDRGYYDEMRDYHVVRRTMELRKIASHREIVQHRIAVETMQDIHDAIHAR